MLCSPTFLFDLVSDSPLALSSAATGHPTTVPQNPPGTLHPRAFARAVFSLQSVFSRYLHAPSLLHVFHHRLLPKKYPPYHLSQVQTLSSALSSPLTLFPPIAILLSMYHILTYHIVYSFTVLFTTSLPLLECRLQQGRGFCLSCSQNDSKCLSWCLTQSR